MDRRVVVMAQAVDACAMIPLESVECVSVLDAVVAAERTLAGLKLRLVRRLDVDDVAKRDGASSLAAWLRDRYRCTWGTARRMIAAAAVLATGPVRLRDAVAAGDLHLEQVEAITESLAKLPAVDRPAAADRLVAEAASWDAAVLRRMGALIRDAVDAESHDAEGIGGLERLERREQRDRYLSIRAARDGVGYRVDGRLTCEQAAVVGAALDPLCKPRAADDRSPGQRRADALEEVCKLALNTTELDTGERVSATMLLPAVLGTAGQVLDLGRERRLFSGPIRRALMLRDGGCAFPACDRPARWCQGHHVVGWQDGGGTCLSNAVLLCGFHHRLIHQPAGWTVYIDPADGLPTFIPPPWVDLQQRPRRNRYHRRL